MQVKKQFFFSLFHINHTSGSLINPSQHTHNDNKKTLHSPPSCSSANKLHFPLFTTDPSSLRSCKLQPKKKFFNWDFGYLNPKNPCTLIILTLNPMVLKNVLA